MLAGMFAAAGGGAPISGFPVIESNAVHSAISGSGGGSSVVVPMPAVVDAGDLLLIQLASSVNATTPSGWTSQTNNDLSGWGRSVVLRKVANGTEGGTSVIVTMAGIGFGVAMRVLRISNADTAASPHVASTSVTINGVSTRKPNNLTPAWGADDTLWIVLGWGFEPDAPTGYPFPDDQAHDSDGASITLYFCSKEENIATVVPGNLVLPVMQWGVLQTLGIKPA